MRQRDRAGAARGLAADSPEQLRHWPLSCLALRYRRTEILDRQGGDASEKARALELLGNLESLQGHVPQANQAYERALESVEDPVARQRIENMRHRMGVVARDGARVAYYEHGRGEPTLVLMHPLFYGMGTYQPILESLCQEFRVITVDPRGTGASDPCPSGYLLAEHVEDARAVIEATGDRPVVLVGISRAGSLAINLAVTHPHLVEKLVIISTTPSPRSRLPWWERISSLVRAEHYDEAMREFWSIVVSEPGGRDLIETFVQSSREFSPEVLHNFFLADDPATRLEGILPTLRTPTLVLHGDEDRLVPYEAGRRLAELVPGAQFYTFKGRGHALYATATAEFIQVVRSFLHTDRPGASPA